MIESINWYPGHMKKTRELIQENLKLCDLVLEIVDARIPASSRNPVIDKLVAGKTRVVLFNKSDLADEKATEEWILSEQEKGRYALGLNAMTGTGTGALYKLLKKIEDEKNATRTRKRALRMMVVGVPNVGKSSLINRMVGRKTAKTGDKPGVTRGKQWLALENGMLLLDTPGILWPKFEDPKTGLYLAFCGSIKDEILPTEELALELLKVLMNGYPDLLAARYKLAAIPTEGDPDSAETPEEAARLANPALACLEDIAKARGFLLSGGRIDYDRTARTLLDEFRAGKIGRITLERL
ncbi:MAG: ribosome biogenesis GTPase YlqF [Firmicutes bacterium]|nr:ribosome biogenesis GTPase YlqF [Bacillota bacterium]